MCSSHLGGTTHLVDKHGALEQARPNLCDVFSVKVLCVFLLTRQPARSNVCHVGSACSSHLGGTTHLVDKRGTFEQERITLFLSCSVKVSHLKQGKTDLCQACSVRAGHLEQV